MSGEKASCGCVIGGLHRHACAGVGHVDPPSTPTPMPSEVAETTAGEREVNIIQRIVNAWDCCGTCAGGVLAAHDRATADRVRREEGERIAQAIESDKSREGWGGSGLRALNSAASIARAASVGRGEGP